MGARGHAHCFCRTFAPLRQTHSYIYTIHAHTPTHKHRRLGHESCGAPSTGGHGHWLHHQLVEVNYGGNFVPLDWLLGSYVRDENEWEARQLAKQKKSL